MKETHPIQREILNKLLHTDKLDFSEMKPYSMEGSQFTFHLSKLVEENLVIKNKDGSYSLTEIGKNLSNRFDPESERPNMQAKQSAVFCATRDDEILIYTRLKNPFYGCVGFPTGKVRYGEEMSEAAKRELKEETNLEGDPELRGIRHFRVYDKSTNKILEDKVMYIYEIKNPKGELDSNKEGEFRWIKLSDVHSEVTNPLEEFFEIFEILHNFNGEISFKEVSHFTDKF